jgi:hypothetical protein
MPEKKTKRCTNAACGFHGISVETDKDKCLGCNRDLHIDALSDIFNDLLKGFR